MTTSTKNVLGSSTRTIMKRKEMIQEIWNMSILYQKQVYHHIKFQ